MMQELIKTPRIDWPDIIKGFAIWLMVFCHANVNCKPLVTFIYMFHMPVFFIISGFFDRGEEMSWNAVKKTFKKLMIPYFVYNLLAFTICWVSPYLHPDYYKGIVGFPAIFKAAFIGMFIMDDNITSYSFMPLGCMWFLVALFICKIMWMLVLTCLRKNKVWLFLPLFFSILILLIRPQYFSLDSAIMSIPFYAFGSLLHERKKKLDKISRNELILGSFIAIVLMATLGMYNGKVDLDGCNFGKNAFLFYLNGIIGFGACYCIANLLQSYLEVFSAIGKVSLTVLGIHFYFCIVGKTIGVALLGMNVDSFPLWMPFIIATMACFISVLLKQYRLFHWLP